MELERDDQQPDDDVRQGQVGDEEVGDGLKHTTLRRDFTPYRGSVFRVQSVIYILFRTALTCMRRLVRTMKMTVELPRTAVREVAQYTTESRTTTPI